MKTKIKMSYLLLGIALGILITLLIYRIPRIRYDVNNDGEVTLNDAVKVINYYTSKRIGDSNE